MALTWTTARIRRREDQVWLDFALGNLTVDSTGAGGPVLVRTSPGSAYLAVTLGAQHVAEQVFDEGEARTRPVGTRVAGASRLVFRVPDEVTSLPYTDEALLGWGELALQVAPGAVPRGQMPPAGAAAAAAPDETQTALEIPWRLLLSPAADAAWAHASAPVTHGGCTELWHTRMVATTGGVADEDASAPTLRVLWATDDAFPDWLAGAPAPTVPPAAGLPFRLPLTPRDRVELVRATSDHTIPGYVPDPVDVERLLLSGLGATMSVRGAWNAPPAVLSLIGWQHRVGTGRDQAVRLVQRGHLLPFGHPAALVRVVERVVAAAPDGTATAYLRSRRLLVIGDRTRTYPAYGQRSGGRGLPFTSVTVLDAQSPFLDDPLPLVGALGTGAFVPRVGGAAHAFTFLAVDAAGRRVSFTAPVLFADSVVAYAEADMSLVRAAYNGLPAQDPIRRRPMDAQMVAWAPPADAGDTEVETHAMTFAAEQPVGDLGNTAAFAERGQPLCHPVIVSARVRLPAVDAVAGSATAPVEARPEERYLQAGFGAANPGEVFLTLETPIDLGLPPGRGALMDPGLSVIAVSRRLGPVGGDLGTLATGVIDVPAMLAAAPSQPKIFGAIALSTIVQAVTVPPTGQAVVGAVSLRSRPVPPAQPPGLRGLTARRFPDERPGEEPPFNPRLEFEPQLQSDPLGILTFAPHAYGLVAISYQQGDPQAATRDDQVGVEVLILPAEPWRRSAGLPVPDSGPAVGNDPAFTLTLFGKDNTFIAIDFQKLSLKVIPGRSPEIDQAISGIRFDGVLRFIQRLFSGDGVVSPDRKNLFAFVISASSEYLELGASLTLPDIPLGVLMLKNIRFALTLQVPFFFVPGNRRALVLAFAFASRENPFLIAVYMFGGGGFLRIGVQFRGLQFLEIAFEFGFVRQFPGGPVASGSIEAMVGVYFQLERDTNGSTTITLTAYVRARGELTLVGIVSIILELYLGLSYVAVLGSPGKLVGQARVTLRVKVFFVSIEASATVEHRFSGGDDDGDPTFLDQMPTQAVWDEYVTAFAPVGA